MKTILSLRKHPYIARVSIFLIAVALIVGIVGCDGTTAKYSLTMAVSPPLSGTATDVTGGSPYTSGTAVDIQAAALGSYTFCKWTAPAGTFVDPNLATTKFTMPAQNVTVTANFVGPLDHFKCYDVYDASPLGKAVTLEDQFGAINVTVGNAVLFANPTDKVYLEEPTQTYNPTHHFTFYEIDYEEEPGTWYVEISNQLDYMDEPQYLTVQGPTMLAVPSQKVVPGNHTAPLCLDHFLVYDVISGPVLAASVDLKDEFGTDTNVGVEKLVLFANPVKKTEGTVVTPIQHPADHLAFYELSGTEVSYQEPVQVINQFNTQTQNLYLGGYPATLLGVPSVKVDWGVQIDHFKCYTLTPGAPIGEVVDLDDQFVDVPISANVTIASWFCNPAQKNDEPILDEDHHLMIYWLNDVDPEPQFWSVTVSNQFDDMGPQELYVYGPVALAVPTEKQLPYSHGFPEDLDHYLLYSVVGGTAVGAPVGLKDEFGNDPQVTVAQPFFFANPVQKTHGTVTDIQNDMAHLVFYKITGGTVFYPFVTVVNQFNVTPFEYTLLGPDMLAVPSLKVDFGPSGPP